MPDGATPALLRANAFTGLDLNGALRARTGIDKDANGIAQQLTGRDLYGASSALISRVSNGLNLTGGAASYASTPDHADFDPPADIFDLRVECAINSATLNRTMVSKFAATGNQRSWQLVVTPAFGIWSLITWQSGAASPFAQHSAGFASTRAFRVVVTASPALTTFYTAQSFDSAWVQIGSFNTLAQLPFFDSSAPIELGARNGGTGELWIGTIFRAQAFHDGALVMNPDLRSLPAGTTSFTDSTGKVWTVHGGASVGLGGPSIFP